jgi:hypothetical protein
MKYNLMSPYTSLVAVEKTEGEEGEKEKKELITINVPSILPEGLNYDVFSSPPVGRVSPEESCSVLWHVCHLYRLLRMQVMIHALWHLLLLPLL